MIFCLLICSYQKKNCGIMAWYCLPVGLSVCLSVRKQSSKISSCYFREMYIRSRQSVPHKNDCTPFLSYAPLKILKQIFIYEPGLEISNNVLYATSKASDKTAHMGSLIRAFASLLNIL